MKHNIKCLSVIILLSCISVGVKAAPREAGKADNGAILKLQSMVKSLTSERDAAKTETAKLTLELDELKKQKNAVEKAAAEMSTAKAQLDAQVESQASSLSQFQESLQKSNDRLRDLIEKHKQLNLAKNQLSNDFATLTTKQQATEQQLQTCEEHNIKLFESGKDLLEHYQTKGTIAGLLQDEPVLQFKSIEMENIVQDYEDKLRSGIYKPKSETNMSDVKPPAAEITDTVESEENYPEVKQ